MEEKTTILNMDAYKTAENTYIIRLTNGKEITVQTNVYHCGVENCYKVEDALFSQATDAVNYLRELIQEKLSGIRYIYHRKVNPPELCKNGVVCSSSRDNWTLPAFSACYSCPITEEHFAERDGVKVVYAVE